MAVVTAAEWAKMTKEEMRMSLENAATILRTKPLTLDDIHHLLYVVGEIVDACVERLGRIKPAEHEVV
jgi:hypothetical protein